MRKWHVISCAMQSSAGDNVPQQPYVSRVLHKFNCWLSSTPLCPTQAAFQFPHPRKVQHLNMGKLPHPWNILYVNIGECSFPQKTSMWLWGKHLHSRKMQLTHMGTLPCCKSLSTGLKTFYYRIIFNLMNVKFVSKTSIPLSYFEAQYLPPAHCSLAWYLMCGFHHWY